MWHLAQTAKSTKSWLNDHGVGVLDWPANSPDLYHIENLILKENLYIYIYIYIHTRRVHIFYGDIP